MRRGWALRQVARDAGVSLSTVQLWVGRAQHRRLDEVDWADRSSRPRRTSRTPRPLEDLVLQVRQELRDTSDLGEFGAGVIRAELLAREPARRPISPAWTLDLQMPPRGVLIYLRRTTERGAVHLLGRTFDVDPSWPFRLVRCEVHLDAGSLRCYALRRRNPAQQPLLAEIPYVLPRRRFSE